MARSIVVAIALLGAPAGAQVRLELIDVTLGEPSSTPIADLPRGHLVRVQVSGDPGNPVVLAASPEPPGPQPPLIDGRPLLIDLPTAVVMANGLTDPAAVIGPDGRFSLCAVVPRGPAVGTPLWMQAATIDRTGRIRLSNGMSAKVADVHVFDFEQGSEGWVGGFADYPVGQDEFYELGWGHDRLPPPLHPAGSLRVEGHNHSDDLFMFLTRAVGDLVPGVEYAVEAEVRLASQYPRDSIGVGGGPGSAVYLHAGATDRQPRAVVQAGAPSWWVMNIDKGNQATPGSESAVLGDIGIPGSEYVYTLIERSGGPVQAAADAGGELWLFVGTDSGFEAFTRVYFDRLVFRIRR